MSNPDYLWEEEIKVRYVETDQMGVVHHSYVPVYFEAARSALFKNFVKSYAAIERRGVFAPIIAYTVDIILPAFYEDILVVRVKPMDYTGVRLTLSYQLVRKETGELLATGFTTNVFVDEERKPINIRSKFPEIYKLIMDVFKDVGDDSEIEENN
jgi:acyl-CoA thioester hydrolase